MARNTSVSLDEHVDRFIDSQIDGGRYGSASDVVRAGLQLLEEHQAKLDDLRSALIEGEASGSPEPFDTESFLRSKHGSR